KPPADRARFERQDAGGRQRPRSQSPDLDRHVGGEQADLLGGRSLANWEGRGRSRIPPRSSGSARHSPPPRRGREHRHRVVPSAGPCRRTQSFRGERSPGGSFGSDARGKSGRNAGRRCRSIAIGPSGSPGRRRPPGICGGPTMRLLCDHMLGSLARWLRFIGYDTAYPEPGPDRSLTERARAEDRILLTRDKELAARVTVDVQIRSDTLEDQIREVASALPRRLVDQLSRCSLCNAILLSARLEDVKDFVPEGVRSRQRVFWRCPSCSRVYWRGTHWDKVIARLNDLDLSRAP